MGTWPSVRRANSLPLHFPFAFANVYSTVTLLARLRGWSISQPRSTPQ